MAQIRIQLLRNQSMVADQCIVAERFFERLKGLIGTTHFVEGQAVLFPRCNNIHMWMMRIPIDVVFLNGTRVSSVRENLRPWRPLPVMDMSAKETLELPVGSVSKFGIHAGDELCFSSA